MGEVSLLFSGDKILVLEDCLYVSNVRRNLFQFVVFHIMDFQQYSIKSLFLLNMMLMRSVVEC